MPLPDFHVSDPFTLGIELEMQVVNPPGYDLSQDETRSAVLLALVGGSDANEVMKAAGVVPTGRLAGLAAVAVDDVEHAGRQQVTYAHTGRANSITQFTSQVAPPSSENACCQRGAPVCICDHSKRTRTGRPSNSSSPSNRPTPS